jgi:hypothetical protein
MLLNKFKFFDQIARRSDYYNVNSFTGKHDPYDQSVAWNMYKHANNPVHRFLVFGRTNIERGENMRLSRAIENIDLWNLGATNKDFGTREDYIPASFQGGGAILRYQTIGSCTWHELYNHAWLLGGIHGRTEFHSASTRTIGMVLSGNVPSMWGHELLFLDFFGYWPRKAFGQEIWKPLGPTPKKTLGDFLDYFEGIKNNPNEIWRKIGDPTVAVAAPVTRADRNKWAKTETVVKA